MSKKIKSLISLCLTIIVSASILNMSAVAKEVQPRSDYSYCFVNTDGGNLNGRSGPGEEYSIVCKYANGTSLSWSVMPDASGTDSLGRPWIRVFGKTTTGESKSAWVCEDYVRYESAYNREKSTPVIINSSLPDVG